MALVSQKPHSSEPPTAVLAELRTKVANLEGIQRRLARIIPICDVVDQGLPYKGLPTGCVHEVTGSGIASAIGFASLLAARADQNKAIFYIDTDRSFYPLGLLQADIRLNHWIHVRARRASDLVWTVLEVIRCPQVGAVLAMLKAADLTYCRRLQLAAENSGATGFLLNQAGASSVASAITRWQVSSVKGPAGRSLSEAFWKLELLYCRSGRPGKWMLACKQGRLEHFGGASEIPAQPMQRVAGASETALAG